MQNLLMNQRGVWSSVQPYPGLSQIYGIGGALYNSIDVVSDGGQVYYANGASVPVTGTHPAADGAWSLWLSVTPNILTAVAVATTVNITLSGEQTIDGVLTSTSRVLVKNQTLSQNNGVYVSAAGAWSRSTDANDWEELVNAQVTVIGGSTQAGYGYICTVQPGGTLGTTPVTWALNSTSLPALPNGQLWIGNASNIATPNTLSGGATVNNAGVVTLGNTAVTGQLITGFVSGAGTVAATDTILQAVNKLDGNTTAKLTSTLASANIFVGNVSNVATAVAPSGGFTINNTGVATLGNSAVTGQAITGYVSGAGTVAATDSILQAVQKLNGNLAGSFTATNAANGGVVNTITPIQEKWISGATGGAITNGTAAQLTLTWAAAFTTAMYAVSLTCLDSTADVPLTTKVISQTTSAIVVEIANTSLTTPTGGAVTIYAQAVGH